jgi:hypothetical protein
VPSGHCSLLLLPKVRKGILFYLKSHVVSLVFKRTLGIADYSVGTAHRRDGAVISVTPKCFRKRVVPGLTSGYTCYELPFVTAHLHDATQRRPSNAIVQHASRFSWTPSVPDWVLRLESWDFAWFSSVWVKCQDVTLKLFTTASSFIRFSFLWSSILKLDAVCNWDMSLNKEHEIRWITGSLDLSCNFICLQRQISLLLIYRNRQRVFFTFYEWKLPIIPFFCQCLSSCLQMERGRLCAHKANDVVICRIFHLNWYVDLQVSFHFTSTKTYPIWVKNDKEAEVSRTLSPHIDNLGCHHDPAYKTASVYTTRKCQFR